MTNGGKITQRIDAVTGLTPEFSQPCLPPPKAVKLELTARCDFGCYFCATGRNRRKGGDMDWDTLTRILRGARAAGVEQAGLFYLGESMLYPRLVDAIRYAKATCGFPFVFLTTNGRLATEARVEACVRAGLDSLKFSLNAAGPAEFERVTRVDAFETVVANIKGARRAIDRVHQETGHRCRLYVSSAVHGDEHRARMDDVIAGLAPYIDEHYYLPLHGHAQVEAGLPPDALVGGAIGRVGAERPSLPCWSLFTVAHVTHEGRFSACCWDHDGRFAMGDAATGFMAGWNSAEFQTLRRAHLAGDVHGTVCETCIYGRRAGASGR